MVGRPGNIKIERRWHTFARCDKEMFAVTVNSNCQVKKLSLL